mmetsp:Transcript_15457/g.45928  ORF Transcript_15457/g.45928 Transcript_15457/m.45928 type:complete len:272 (+) Transcript_15457:165-980(+)
MLPDADRGTARLNNGATKVSAVPPQTMGDIGESPRVLNHTAAVAAARTASSGHPPRTPSSRSDCPSSAVTMVAPMAAGSGSPGAALLISSCRMSSSESVDAAPTYSCVPTGTAVGGKRTRGADDVSGSALRRRNPAVCHPGPRYSALAAATIRRRRTRAPTVPKCDKGSSSWCSPDPTDAIGRRCPKKHFSAHGSRDAASRPSPLLSFSSSSRNDPNSLSQITRTPPKFLCTRRSWWTLWCDGVMKNHSYGPSRRISVVCTQNWYTMLIDL